MKKVLALLLAAILVFSFAACAGSKDDTTTSAGDSSSAPASDSSSAANTDVDYSKVKAGFIFLHDENSTYDKNFIEAAKAACEKLGIEYVFKTNVPEEGDKCYQEAADLADSGCNIVFADSFGHEDNLIRAAKEFPNVQFCHSTGVKAHTEGLKNYHNAFASIYEGRYLAGIAAGLKLKEMIDSKKITEDQAKMGYVGAYTYAEVISGYTSFYLGAKSVVPSVTMEVQFTGSWYDETKEKEAATTLIKDGCVLISQHADSMGAPTACENAKVPNVSYNGSTERHARIPSSYPPESTGSRIMNMHSAALQRVKKSRQTGPEHSRPALLFLPMSTRLLRLRTLRRPLTKLRQSLKAANFMYLIPRTLLLAARPLIPTRLMLTATRTTPAIPK